MGSIIKNEFNLKLVIFVSSVIIMISCYSLGSALYKSMFDITSHRSAGMIFISFYFLLIASPILFITLLIALRVSLALLFCGIGYLFFRMVLITSSESNAHGDKYDNGIYFRFDGERKNLI